MLVKVFLLAIVSFIQLLKLLPHFRQSFVLVLPLVLQFIFKMGLGLLLLHFSILIRLTLVLRLLFQSLSFFVVLHYHLSHDVQLTLLLQLLVPLLHLLHLHIEPVIWLGVTFLQVCIFVEMRSLYFFVKLLKQHRNTIDLIKIVLVVLLEFFKSELAYAVSTV